MNIKMKQKFYTFYLAIAAFVLFAASAIAQTYPATSYQLSNDKKTLLRWTGSETSIDLTTDATFANIVTVNYEAFAELRGVKTITLPSTVTNIGGNAFYNCVALTSVNIPYGVERIEGGTFYGCASLASISIPTTVTNIGYQAFYGCTALTAIDLPASVSYIGGQAFAYSGLTSIEIPEAVTGSLENGMFMGCTSLATVVLPSNISYIGYQAFYGCTALKSVTAKAAVPPGVDGTAFYNVNKASATLYVPAASLASYRTAVEWKDFYSILAIDVLSSITDASTSAEYAITSSGSTVSITTPQSAVGSKASIYTASGSLAATVTLTSTQTTLSTSSFAPGIYLINIAGVATKKFAVR